MPEGPLLFLCYAREDKKHIDEIYLEMKAAGLNPWMDHPPAPYDSDGIPLGVPWDLAIRTNIRRAAYCITFLSTKSVSKKGYVQEEYRVALEALSEMPPGQVFVVPALLEECQLPDWRIGALGFDQLQWINLTADGTQALIRFLKKDLPARMDLMGGSSTLFIAAASADELVRSVGSQRTITLREADYAINTVSGKHLADVSWESDFDGETMTVRGVKNLQIRGASEGRSRVIVTPQYVHVIRFEGCTDISLSNLTLGHEPKQGYCTGGVLHFVGCSNVTVSECDLFGCGTEGLRLDRVDGFVLDRSRIRDCTDGIMSVSDSSGLRFTTCEFTGNREYYGISIHNSKDVTFQGCVIRDNSVNDAVFDIRSSALVRVIGAKIRGNTATALVKKPAVIEMEDIEEEGNSYQQR